MTNCVLPASNKSTHTLKMSTIQDLPLEIENMIVDLIIGDGTYDNAIVWSTPQGVTHGIAALKIDDAQDVVLIIAE